MDKTFPSLSDLDQVRADIERGKADAAAGRTIPMEPVLAAMLESAERLEQHLAEQEAAVLKA